MIVRLVREGILGIMVPVIYLLHPHWPTLPTASYPRFLPPHPYTTHPLPLSSPLEHQQTFTQHSFSEGFYFPPLSHSLFR